ncbi:DUF2264 domain-containing protein [Devosia ginsengisoli]|uniref:DUF2264 domain-containing protein n=1 Tax=Devosia ginsengisoli TaxID=400770 RepID=UPI0026ED71B9|nr:DUF2264 domain-containing protein [Devosia ginsengisoli]MCR6670695.1 DUF2264 domain-containing protein [Devosia ginsengisoli]
MSATPMHPRHAAPVTTRDEMAAYLRALHAPLEAYYSPGRARVRLAPFAGDFDVESAELEGFARPLWGLAPLLKGGYELPFWPEVLKGLGNGVDPEHPEYWGDVVDFDQRIVESAAISFTLLLVPEKSWALLDDRARTNLGRWLRQVTEVKSPPNNWGYFSVLAHLALNALGYDTDRQKRDALLDFLESCAMGPDGWSSDGHRPQVDHYIGFAMHFYGLLYAQFSGDDVRGKRLRDRARAFGRQFREWFADDGAALPYGRSLPYRFAHGSFWSAAAFADASAFDPGALKRLALGNIRWWQGTEALDRDGVLSMGYAYPNPVVAEFYTSAQSPYWAFKAFLPLALPADHPFWQATEEAPPSELDARIQPVPGMVMQRHQGVVTALTGGQEAADRFLHTAEKYSKFAYSTRYGFGVERDSRCFAYGAFDSMLALSTDGIHFAMRKHSDLHGIVDGMQYSRWSPLPGVVVESASIPAGVGHFRAHLIESDVALDLAEGGFSLPMPSRSSVSLAATDSMIMLTTGEDASALHVLAAPASVTLQHQIGAPGSHLYFPRAVVPQARLSVAPGRHLLASWFAASPDKVAVVAGPPALPALEPLFEHLRAHARPPKAGMRHRRMR